MRVKTIFYLMMILSLVQFSCDITGDCNNHIYARINNNGRTFKILKFDRGCGATTANSIQLSLVKFIDSLPDEPGNLFISTSKVGAYVENDTSIQASWRNDTTILIKYDKDLEIFKKDSLSYNIKVVYEIK